MTTVRSRATICSRCHADSSRTSTASAATSSSIDDAKPALLEQLAQRVAAAGRLEDVRAEQRVVDEVGRHDAQRLRVVRDDRALADGADELGRVLERAGQHLVGARDGEAPRRVGGEELALGDLARAHGEHELVAREPRDVGERARAHARARASSRPRAPARPPRRRGTPRGGAAGRAARTRGRPRAASSGPARGRPRRRRRGRRAGRAASSRAPSRPARPRRGLRGSPCAWRPEILSIEPSTPSRSP